MWKQRYRYSAEAYVFKLLCLDMLLNLKVKLLLLLLLLCPHIFVNTQNRNNLHKTGNVTHMLSLTSHNPIDLHGLLRG
jgi:hypothetical protein